MGCWETTWTKLSSNAKWDCMARTVKGDFKLFIFYWGIVDITLSVSGVQQHFSICIQYEAIILISLVTIWNFFKSQTKDWCWNLSYNTLATWCKELTHWKRPPCWERLRAEGEGGEREMVEWYHWLNGHEFKQTLGDWVKDREAWHAAVHGVAKRCSWLNNWTTQQKRNPLQPSLQ